MTRIEKRERDAARELGREYLTLEKNPTRPQKFDVDTTLSSRVTDAARATLLGWVRNCYHVVLHGEQRYFTVDYQNADGAWVRLGSGQFDDELDGGMLFD